ncbi:MAG: 50S ribosomal protein L18 [Nitrospirae bacterium]|nr:50S ribosomal protein L18 [Nitrospirota bacterium]MBI4838597.1 50S ribosomal protein L18 [Nitrospirota bacterium]
MLSYVKNDARERRHERARKKIYGTSERPRLNIFKSLKHVYAQIIDDSKGATLAAASSQSKDFSKKIKTGGNIAAAKEVGTLVAKKAVEKGIKKVVFDRGGYPYHGRVKTLADAAREAGLEF